jgi:hypothetical protein
MRLLAGQDPGGTENIAAAKDDRYSAGGADVSGYPKSFCNFFLMAFVVKICSDLIK